MAKKTPKEIREEFEKLFLSKFEGNPPLKLLYFHTFLCPVAMAEIMVKEHIVEDFDALELLFLRLYDVGFHSVKSIANLSGMDEKMIERAHYNEVMVYHHIDNETGLITDMGYETLKENASGNAVSHTMYDTPRRMQIEAATGTVIPGYLEDDVRYMKQILGEKDDGIVPIQSVAFDEELKNEINTRLLEYTHKDILNEGDTIVKVEKLHTTQIFYRWAYLAKFDGMRYPMIVMSGYKSVDKLNAESIKNKKYGEKVAVPLSISETDDWYLRNHGICFDDVLVRKDSAFEYLLKKASEFNFNTEDEDIQMDEEEFVYEDEKIAETEDMENDDI
jgi:hypothetical protein